MTSGIRARRFKAMANKTEKNGAIGSVIDENRGRDDAQITKIREEFEEEVSILHQTIEDLQADVALCKRSLTSGGGVNVVDDASKIKMATRYLKDTAALWWRRRHGDIEQGWAKTELELRGVQDIATAITYVEALIDFNTRRDSFKPKIKRARDFRKKASLNGMSAHEDEDASNGGSMGSVRILNAIKVKTKVLKVIRKGLQYVEATINGVKVCALVFSGATHNFVAVNEAERLGINATKGSGTIKAVGTIDLSVVSMDDFKVVLGLEFLDKVRAFPMSFANSLCILDGGKTCIVSTEPDAKSGSKTLSAMQFKKGFNKNEPCYLAVTRLETDEGSSKVEVPKVIEQVIDEFKDVMPKELPKKLPPMREELRKQLKELMDAGYIRPSKAPYGASMLFQRKKDGSLRMCIDYRALNKVTIKNKFPIPLIANLFDQLGKARYFTKLDLRSGYYQVRIAEGDEAKTTCVTSHTSEEHVLHLKQVFQVLQDNELYVKLEKCSFAQDEVEFLGHKIKDRGLTMDGAKIKAIQEWEPPTKDEECQAAFESLKKAVMKEPVLRLPDVTMPFELHTDASDFAIGGVLTQDGHLITFEIQKLNEMERKRIILKECHDSKWAGHSEIKRTLALVDGSYYWPRMGDDVETFVRTYLICQQDKIEQKKSEGLLEPLPTPKGPWESVSMDFITCLPKSEGSGSIIVVVDRFSKYGTFIAAPPDVTADNTAKLFFKNVVKYWGVPHVIVSDRDPRFTGRFWMELFKIMGMDLNISTSFHPQTDGQTERVNTLLELYLRHYSEATGKSPFELVTGRQPLTPNALAASYEGSSPAAYKTRKEWHEQANMARASLEKATKRMKKWADERRRHVEFKVGDQVMAPTAVVTSYDRKVEEILSDRTIRRRGVPSYKEYLIKWRDLPDSEASWEAKTYCGSLRTRSRDITRMARRGRRELRLGGILWKVKEGLGSPWKIMEVLETLIRRLLNMGLVLKL
nr:hypothetical protein [Tanacetum cinerariifolium]